MNKDILNLLKDRYFLSTESSWEDIAERVGKIYPEATDLIKEMKFVPSSPTLMNANTNGLRKGGLSSCFIMGIEDSIEGIFDAMKEGAIVTKNAGGVGYDFSKLRSSTETIKTLDGRKSSGPLPFMDMFNSMLDGIRQGGARKGAGGAWLNIDHPSILEFINAKKNWESQRLNRFNLSVRIPNWFYEKLESDPDSTMMVKNVTDSVRFPLVDEDGREVSVKDLWDKIIKLAHFSAEPGILNSDIMFDRCSVTNYDKNVGSNPCSEFSNITYASCNLGSINLSKYVLEDEYTIDIKQLGKDIEIATRYLDNVIDVNTFPIPNIEKVTRDIRPIGLGVMGVAHMFMKLEIPFNSNLAYKMSKKLMTYITLKSMETSNKIAIEKGKPYEAFDFDTFYKANERFWNSDIIEDDYIYDVNVKELIESIRVSGTRNSCFTSIAPTGTISFISEATGGIEPIFALSFMRKIEKEKDKDNKLVYETVHITDKLFDSWLDEYYKDLKSEILEYVSKNKGSVQGCPHLSDYEQSLFLTAGDLTPDEHLDSLEPWAVSTSLSVSKTINVPNDASEEDIATAYLKAYKKGIIGVSVYRDGARGGVLVHQNSENDLSITKTHAPKRPNELDAEIHTFVVNKQSYYVAIGFYKDDPYEVFTGSNVSDSGEIYIPKTLKKGKIIKHGRGKYSFMDSEGLEYSLTNGHSDDTSVALTRSISTSLRHGAPLDVVVSQLEKTKGPMNSFSKAISRMIKKYIKNGVTVHGEECPSCGSKLMRIEGCKTCTCGYSACS